MKSGTTFADRYEIEELAGRGGMSTVYKAQNRAGRQVAIKVLDAVETARSNERFAREARILSRLHHPAIVSYLDQGTTESGVQFLVMEWLEGQTLSAHLREHRLPIASVLALGQRIAGALAAAHAHGVVHRDVKPGNIFLPAGDVDRAKLLDFGIAGWNVASQMLTAPGVRLGTLAYMSPEQARDSRVISPSADVFSLGCVLYECLTGEPAFSAREPMAVLFKILFEDAPRVSAVMSRIPAPLDELVSRMLDKNTATRPQHGGELITEFERLIRELGARSVPATPVGRGITTSEQRLVSVIVARLGDRGERSYSRSERAHQSTHDSRDPATDSTVRLLSSDPRARVLEQLEDTFRSLGARWDIARGGALVAVVDAPGEATDQAVEAARCALALCSHLPGVPAALATGWAVLGRTRTVGEVIDRAVALLNFADSPSRGDAQTTSIHVDENTAGLIEASFEIYRRAGHAVLASEREVLDERPLLGRVTPFVGRNRELATLMATLDECSEDGVARAVLITGPAGIGKSRLMREFVRRIRERGLDVELWIGGGDPSRAGSSLDTLASVIRRIAGIRKGEPLSVRRHKLNARVARHISGADTARVAAFLGELVKTPFPDHHDVALRAARRDARLMSDQIRRACEDLIASATDNRTVVILLDDLHWGDQATVDVIDQTLRNLSEQPLLIVALARPRVRQLFPQLWVARNVTEMRLDGLSRRAAEKFVRAVLAVANAEHVQALINRAAGNPFYLEELVRSAAAGPPLVPADRAPGTESDAELPSGPAAARPDAALGNARRSSYRAERLRGRRFDRSAGRGIHLPASILAMVQARLNAVDIHARRVLRAASIFGNVFWSGGAAALIGSENSAESDEILAELVSRELVSRAPMSRFPDHVEYEFNHDMVRECAYSMLPEGDRQRGHRLAGEWLEKVGEVDDQMLAMHFENGGWAERAVHYYIRSAESALDSGGFEATLSLAERGLNCGAKKRALGSLRRLQIEVYLWQGRYAQAGPLIAEALDNLPGASEEWYQVAGDAAFVWSRLGQPERVAELIGSLARWRGDSEEREARLITKMRIASELFLSGHRVLASPLYAAIESELGEGGADDPGVAARLHELRGVREYAHGGDPASMLKEYEQCLAHHEAIGDLRRACFNRTNLGYSKFILGLYDDAERDLRRALEAAEQMGLAHAVANAQTNLGQTLAALGRLDEAEVLQRKAAEFFARQGYARGAASAEIELAGTLFLADRLDEAENVAGAGLARLAERASLRALALAILARIALARGDAEQALLLAGEAAALLDDLGHIEEGEARVRLIMAEALYASGDEDAARVAIETARRRLLEAAGKISEPT